MTDMVSPSKRSVEEVDNDLLALAAEQNHVHNEQQKKKRRRQYAPMTQYNTNSAATQSASVNSDSNSRKDDLPCGYIKKVILRNFMCHEHFELDLGPRLNFIVGNNGSGKSAVLTAITIGLGAKASDTNRGNAMKDLIREGCYSAKVTLVLDNSHAGPYNHGTFGDEIIIERTLRMESAPTYSLRTENGKEVSNKKKDVQTVVDFFCVPVSNPMCFLSQDAARSFLTASTSHDKYNHFMKGTLLQEIRDSLNNAQDIQADVVQNMAFHYDNIAILKNEYEESKKLLRELNQTSNLAQRKRLLQGKSLWIDVDKNHEIYSKLENEVTLNEKKITETMEKIKMRKAKIDRYTADQKSVEEETASKVVLVGEKDEAHQAVRDQLRAVRSEFDKEKENQKEAENGISECKRRIETLNRTIEHLEQELEKQMGGDRGKMKEELAQLQAENEQLRDKVENISNELLEMQDKERTIAAERQQDLRTIEHNIQSKRNELQKIAQGNNSFLTNFDQNMDRLLLQIKQRSGEFSSIPLGPLGSFVSVKAGFEKWSRSIQSAISGTLGSFVVSNQKDASILRNMIKNCGIKANIPIITYKLKHFDYSQGKAQTNYPTISDALEYSNPSVEFVFVDHNRIEKVILIEDKDEARSILKSKPHNVSMALSFRDQSSGFQLIGGSRLDTVYYQPKMKLKVGSSSDDGASYIKDLITQETEELQNTRDRYERQINQIRSEYSGMEKISREQKAQMQRNRSRINKLKINVGKAVDTGILTTKINERKSQEQAIIGYEAAINELEIKIREIAATAEPLKEHYDKTKNEFNELQATLGQLRDDYNTYSAKIEACKDDIKHYEDKKLSYEKTIEHLNSNIIATRDGIQKITDSANELCTREQLEGMDLPEDQQAIKNELGRISQQIQRAEKNIGFSHDKVVDLFEKSRDKYKDAEKKFGSVDRALRQLQHSIEVRSQNYTNIQNNTCLEADLDFRASLKVRKFTGNLTFQIAERKLDMLILTANDEKARNVDTLSGGEKSFSQLALLLATWKPMRSRIIALDEFDVFMDQVNRRIGTTLVVKKLKDLLRTQTIIITPQDIGKIANVDSEGVNIHRMRDPQRQNNSNFYV
ncbi:DNA repair protein SMC6 NDAI_0J02180 [Naumovozyma dairenensis CBS 421]|uniref:RecF/RecN/SMC N-terminal domain-containing protein n=1 Tax=Naumovozyma dairenensis (strain ATCC 10597 / BCRC 20456 / CBS 421 / NBRC 0211 / NRRL Y-12639) TaxID=1071378 RepID=G0WH32_NAUDC|nr:hypothetical protein NDAI_0J02180 [Naumovozyma dairenensis CBS 421]CCD27110.1 hypothetical protein NDAI_0J02180 [Naumovozyma dairenensis CBS 421]